MEANRNLSTGLKGELARFCLSASRSDPNLKLAWMNSVCLLFLLVGLVGWRRAAVYGPSPPLSGEGAAVIVEPMAQPPATDDNQEQEQADADKTETPQIVSVALDTPAINFAVPTIGNLVVPTPLAKAPPAAPLKRVVQPISVSSTGAGGQRPQPPYPKIALDSAQQGSVALLINVEDSGVINSVEIKESSGWPILDRATLEFIKRHWVIPPSGATRLFEATITYKLTLN